MVLEKENVVDWRKLIGPNDAKKAKVTHPHSIRAMCGMDAQKNCVHGSDSSFSAEKEIKFFFDTAAGCYLLCCCDKTHYTAEMKSFACDMDPSGSFPLCRHDERQSNCRLGFDVSPPAFPCMKTTTFESVIYHAERDKLNMKNYYISR